MGHLQAQEFKDILGRELGIKTHLKCNFYPPLPTYVQKIMVKNFMKYWKRNFDPQTLLNNINKDLGTYHNKHPEAIITGLNTLNQFSEFIKEADLV